MKKIRMTKIKENKLRNTVLAFGVAGLLTAGIGAGVGLVSAQTDTEENTPTDVTSTDTDTTSTDDSATDMNQPKVPGRSGFGGFGRRGFGGHGLGGYGFGGPVALGTTVTYTFYDGDPEADGSVTDTLTFTSGEDSEAAFAETMNAARTDATFATIQTSEQTYTLDLSAFNTADDTDADAWRGRGLGFIGRGLSDGSSVTATFYDSDPEAGAEALETLSFTYGQDSEAGFADDVQTALENATFVTVTTGPQERTMDLSQQMADDYGPGFGGDWDGQGGHGRGGPGRGGWGHR